MRGEIALAEHRELNLGVVELGDVDTLAVCSLHHGGLDDVHLVAADAMPGRHLCVHLLNGAVQGEIAELLVHVVEA